MSSSHPLGLWAVIDIETTGIDPNYDSIIDVGFLQFEGTKLIRKYSSLVQYDGELSYFIQKLTGINKKMLRNAPSWKEVEPEVLDLYGHHLIAHNADFEKSFLKDFYTKIEDETQRESYEDSIYFLSLLFPNRSFLNLESFICDWKIADSEKHRGFEDSVDLLKVMLLAVKIVRQDKELNQNLKNQFSKYNLKDFWYYKFFSLSDSELIEIASEIDFDLESALQKALDEEEIIEETSLNEFSQEFSGENIKSIFKDEETISTVFPNYTYRETQVNLALKVGQCFKNNIHSLVQAPTGTGKTIGYLLPAALFCLNENKQVLVSTGTKTLQHQAINKDVPQLKKLLGLSDSNLKVRHLVGSNNHFCELLFRQNLDDDLLSLTDDFHKKFVDMFFEMVFFYNLRSSTKNILTRDDLPYVLKRKTKKFAQKDKEIAVDFRACTGRNCPYNMQCSYQRGLREARDADIIIGNHALMFSWPKGFPRPSYVIVDEAHKIEGETTKAFSYEASEEVLKSLSNSLLHLQGIGSLFYLLAHSEEDEGDSSATINSIKEKILDIQKVLESHLKELQDLVEIFFKKSARYNDVFWNERPMIDGSNNADTLSVAISNHLNGIRFNLGEITECLQPYLGRWDVNSIDDENMIVAITRFETLTGQIEDLSLAFEYILEEKEDYCRSFKYHAEHGFLLQSSPVNVGKVLHEGLLNVSSSVVYTSATLGNAKGDQGTKGIEWVTGYIYLEPEKRFRSGFYLPAVYDYQNKSKVFLCDDVPPFYDNQFIETVLTPVIKLIKELKGRSLLLFGAKKRFEIARELMLREFEGELPLFVQGMGRSVVDEFKKVEQGVLIGMESFGEGIDIPGDSLQFVFIDKIPDLRMDLVIDKRRDFYERSFGNEFMDYYLAHRTRSLHQKLGRLLRTENDIGGAIIVDSRIKKWKGSTINKVFKLMEPYEIQRISLQDACSKVRAFIETKN